MTFEEAVQSDIIVVFSKDGYAVALQYDSDDHVAPYILIRARDFDAYRLITLALSAKCSMFEEPAIAKVLYRWDDVIPHWYFEPIAGILREIHRKQLENKKEQAEMGHREVSSYRYFAPLFRRRGSVVEFEVQIGEGLIQSVDEIISRVRQLRRRLAANEGLDFPTIVIRDYKLLDSNRYRILVRNIEMASGEVRSGHVMRAGSATDSAAAVHPLWRMPVTWIPRTELNDDIISGGIIAGEFLTPEDVILAHIDYIIRRHMAKWMTLDRVKEIIDIASSDDPTLLQNILQEFQHDELRMLLRELVSEHIPIVDRELLFSTIWANRSLKSDFRQFVEAVRKPLVPLLCSSMFRKSVLMFDPMVEEDIVRRDHEQMQDPLRTAIGIVLDKFRSHRDSIFVFVVRNKLHRRAMFEQLVRLIPEESGCIVVLDESEIPANINVEVAYVSAEFTTPIQALVPNQGFPLLSAHAAARVDDVLERWGAALFGPRVDREKLAKTVLAFYENHNMAPPDGISFCAHPFIPGICIREFSVDSIAAKCGLSENFKRPMMTTLSKSALRMQTLLLGQSLEEIRLGGMSVDAAETVYQSLVSRVRGMVGQTSRSSSIQQLLNVMNSADSIRRIQQGLDTEASIKDVFAGVLRASALSADWLECTNVIEKMSNRVMQHCFSMQSIEAFDYPCALIELEEVILRHLVFSAISSPNANLHPDPDLNREIRVEMRDCELALDFYAAGGWLFDFYDKYAFVVMMPQIKSGGAQLHAEDGPAVIFADGSELYAYQGTVVPAKAITAPLELSINDILGEPNAEVRRVLIGRIGISKFIEIAHPTVLDEDTDNLGNSRRLYRIELEDDEPLVVLHLVDPAKLRLGENADVFLRVPPDESCAKRAAVGNVLDERFWHAVGREIKKCGDAVAWTFGMMPDEYRPIVET